MNDSSANKSGNSVFYLVVQHFLHVSCLVSHVSRQEANVDCETGDDKVLENLVRFIVNRSLEDYILIGINIPPFLKKDKQNPLAH